MFKAMSNRKFTATATLGLAGMLMVNSCASPEEDEQEPDPEPGYSGLTNFCTDLEYQALEDEFGVIDPAASHEELEGWVAKSKTPPELHCGTRSYYTADEALAAHLDFSVFLEHEQPYGLDIPEEDAAWFDPYAVYPMGTEGSPGVAPASVREGLISKGQSEQTDQTNFASITYAAFQTDRFGNAWDPEGAGEALFAWYEDENLLIVFVLRVTDELYDASPDPEHLISVLNGTAEEIRQQLEYTPAEE